MHACDILLRCLCDRNKDVFTKLFYEFLFKLVLRFACMYMVIREIHEVAASECTEDGAGLLALVGVKCKSLRFHRRTMRSKCCTSCKQRGRGLLFYFFG